jgi:DNA-binding transcriptional ArsR family regulator
MGTEYIDNLSAALFGKTRRAVLSLLYGHTDESFYIRRILRVVNAGHGAVQRELKQLADAGILHRIVQGQQVYYQANDKCPIFNELKNIVRKTFGIADVIRKSLEPLADRIDAAFIFGSVAGSADNRASDLDLMIIGEITFDDAVSALSKAEADLQREVNAVVYSTAEFRKRVKEKHHFIAEVLEGDKIFVIGDEDDLKRVAGKRVDKGS